MFRYLASIGILAYFIFYKEIRAKNIPFVVLIFVTVLLGPEAINGLINKVQNAEYVQLQTKWVQLTVKSSQGESATADGQIDKRKNIASYSDIIKSIVATETQKNLISNGDFRMPVGQKLGAWGFGVLTDPIKGQLNVKNLIWINFLNADIETSIVDTQIGRALKIVNRTGDVPHKIGIMEQRIALKPGTYKLSFWARAEGQFQPGGLWLTLYEHNWDMTDIAGNKCAYSLKQDGPFEWQEFSDDLVIGKNGLSTFTIVSKGLGTLYLTNIKLVQQTDLPSAK